MNRVGLGRTGRLIRPVQLARIHQFLDVVTSQSLILKQRLGQQFQLFAFLSENLPCPRMGIVDQLAYFAIDQLVRLVRHHQAL